MAKRFLHGSGLEIGAMHFPVPVPKKVCVKYVDYSTPEESAARFPELAGERLVRPDYVEDGFVLPSIPPESQDFVMAHHVLEHASNPLGVLQTWARVLRPGGALFLSVPIGALCFDRNRPVTALSHFIEDAEAAEQMDGEALRARDYHHFVEVARDGMDHGAGEQGAMPSGEVHVRASELILRNEKIHFHVFSEASFRGLLDHFAQRVDPRFKLSAVKSAGIEVMAVLVRR